MKEWWSKKTIHTNICFCMWPTHHFLLLPEAKIPSSALKWDYKYCCFPIPRVKRDTFNFMSFHSFNFFIPLLKRLWDYLLWLIFGTPMNHRSIQTQNLFICQWIKRIIYMMNSHFLLGSPMIRVLTHWTEKTSVTSPLLVEYSTLLTFLTLHDPT